MEKKVYIAGHMLTRGAQLQRAEERSMVEKYGHKFYNPMDNKEINDKTNAKVEALAERIVRHDTDAIDWSDTVIIEPLPEALGTHIELGQMLGMFDLANEINKINESCWNPDIVYLHTMSLVDKILNRKIMPHYEDIRRVEGITESEDRRSLGINQYVYGACLKLTNGKGFYSLEEIEQELAK